MNIAVMLYFKSSCGKPIVFMQCCSRIVTFVSHPYQKCLCSLEKSGLIDRWTNQTTTLTIYLISDEVF